MGSAGAGTGGRRAPGRDGEPSGGAVGASFDESAGRRRGPEGPRSQKIVAEEGHGCGDSRHPFHRSIRARLEGKMRGPARRLRRRRAAVRGAATDARGHLADGLRRRWADPRRRARGWTAFLDGAGGDGGRRVAGAAENPAPSAPPWKEVTGGAASAGKPTLVSGRWRPPRPEEAGKRRFRVAESGR